MRVLKYYVENKAQLDTYVFVYVRWLVDEYRSTG